MKSKKKKNNTIRNIVIISSILLIAVIGTIIYKVQSVNTPSSSLEQNNKDVAQIDEQTNEENESEPKDGDETNDNSGSQVTEKPNQSTNPNTNDPSENNTPSKKPSKSSNASEGESGKTPAIDRVTYIEGQTAPSEPTYINGVLLVNKRYPLPSTYNNGEDPVAKEALQRMLAAGKEAGFTYEAFSGFRSYEYQTTLYNRYVKRDGKENADRYSARPGYSEHQSGLAFDIGEVERKDLWLTEAFGETEAGKWLINNAHQYGFILRYPKGKEHITGFMYESWHYRYVGVEHATKIFESKLTLEEYLGVN